MLKGLNGVGKFEIKDRSVRVGSTWFTEMEIAEALGSEVQGEKIFDLHEFIEKKKLGLIDEKISRYSDILIEYRSKYASMKKEVFEFFENHQDITIKEQLRYVINDLGYDIKVTAKGVKNRQKKAIYNLFGK